MAANYTPVDSVTTTQVLSQTQSRKVEAVSLYTKPSNVFMRVIVPYDAWVKGNESAYLDPPTLLVEQLMGNDLGVSGDVVPIVTAAAFVQDTDSANLLADYMDFTVSYTPDGGFGLPFTQVVRVPMTSLATLAAYSEPISGGKSAQQLILDAYHRLEAFAAG